MGDQVIEELRQFVEDEFSDYYEIAGGKNYRVYHLETVLRIARSLLEELDLDVDEDVVEIAALLHDIGRSDDIEDGEMDPFEGKEGHEERGAEKVSELVSSFVTPEQLEKIEKVIRNHHSRAETVEGKIVQDANRLSLFGVNNLWRKIHYASYFEQTLEEDLEYFWNHQLEEYRDEMENFYFDYTRKVAKERLEKQKETIERIETEIKAGDV